MISGCSPEYHATLQRLFIFGKILPPALLAGLLSLFLIVSPGPATAANTFVHPWLDFPTGWNATVEVVNLGPTATAVRLLAHDGAGTFLGEIPGGMTLAPGERGSYAASASVFPLGTAVVTVLADTPLASVVRLEATDGNAQEILLPGSAPALDLTLPILSGSLPWWTQLRLVNAGTEPTMPTVMARDPAGQVLGSVALPALATWASTTVDLRSLFAPAFLAGAATLQVTADQPLAALQLLGATDRPDVAALPAPLGQGTQLLLPVVTQGPNGPLWTLAGVVNPQDAPVSITAEALDAQGQSVGRLGELTTLPARGSHVLRTPDLGGTLPLGTAAILLTAEQAVSGYALVGGSTTAGLTALAALGPADAPAGYDLVATPDGHVLTAVPWWLGTASQILSPLGEPGAGVWTQRLSTLAAAPGSSASTALMAAAETGQLTPTWTDTANDFDGFKIERKTGASGTYALLATLGAVFTYTDTGLPVGTTYCYQVRAYNAAGDSPPSNEACGTVAAPVPYTLTVSKSGTGTGTVTSNPTGIDCGGTCSASFTAGTSVTLTATPAAGFTFTGWSGEGCSGTGTCVVSMTQARSVTVSFAVQGFALTVAKSGTGSGTVTSSPAAINCGSTCNASFASGTSVTLTATRATGSTFTGWSGKGCSGTGTCVVSMTQARSVTASFALQTQAALTSPTQGSTVHGPSVRFTWSTASGATEYILWVGTTAGHNQLYSKSHGLNLSVTVNNLPTNGSTIFVRLLTRNGTGLLFTDYTFTAAP